MSEQQKLASDYRIQFTELIEAESILVKEALNLALNPILDINVKLLPTINAALDKVTHDKIGARINEVLLTEFSAELAASEVIANKILQENIVGLSGSIVVDFQPLDSIKRKELYSKLFEAARLYVDRIHSLTLSTVSLQEQVLSDLDRSITGEQSLLLEDPLEYKN